MCQHSATNHRHIKPEPIECHTRDGFTSIVGTEWTDDEVERLAQWDEVWGGEAQRPDDGPHGADALWLAVLRERLDI